MFYILIDGEKYLTWYRTGSGIKTSPNLEDAKIYKAKSSAKNALTKVTSMGHDAVMVKKDTGEVSSAPNVQKASVSTNNKPKLKGKSYGVMYYLAKKDQAAYFTLSHYEHEHYKRSMAGSVVGVQYENIKEEMIWCAESLDCLTPKLEKFIMELELGVGTQFIDVE